MNHDAARASRHLFMPCIRNDTRRKCLMAFFFLCYKHKGLINDAIDWINDTVALEKGARASAQQTRVSIASNVICSTRLRENVILLTNYCLCFLGGAARIFSKPRHRMSARKSTNPAAHICCGESRWSLNDRMRTVLLIWYWNNFPFHFNLVALINRHLRHIVDNYDMIIIFFFFGCRRDRMRFRS